MTREEGLAEGGPMGGRELMGLAENPVWSEEWHWRGRLG